MTARSDDALDYQTLVSNLGLSSDDSSVFYADGDLNADGLVDQSDLDSMLSCYRLPATGDFNVDGLVNVADYTFLRDRLRSILPADLVVYLAAWRANYGMTLGQSVGQSVPEPATLLMIAMAASALMKNRSVRVRTIAR